MSRIKRTTDCNAPCIGIMKTKTIHIASNTSGDENAPQYVQITLTPKTASNLLKYRDLVLQASKLDDRFYCAEFFNYTATFGDTDLEIGDEWVQVPDEDSVQDGNISVTANTIKITTGGIIWAACFKHCDGCFESEELSWKDIEAVARGENPFEKAK